MNHKTTEKACGTAYVRTNEKPPHGWAEQRAAAHQTYLIRDVMDQIVTSIAASVRQAHSKATKTGIAKVRKLRAQTLKANRNPSDRSKPTYP